MLPLLFCTNRAMKKQYSIVSFLELFTVLNVQFDANFQSHTIKCSFLIHNIKKDKINFHC